MDSNANECMRKRAYLFISDCKVYAHFLHLIFNQCFKKLPTIYLRSFQLAAIRLHPLLNIYLLTLAVNEFKHRRLHLRIISQLTIQLHLFCFVFFSFFYNLLPLRDRSMAEGLHYMLKKQKIFSTTSTTGKSKMAQTQLERICVPGT